MYIDREVGDEYDKCGIPKEYEIKSKEEIKKLLMYLQAKTIDSY